MTTLFETEPDMRKRAWISSRGKYRWSLARRWGDGPWVSWVMLNPSTADDKIDDPTVRKCIAFCKAWGAGGLCVVNLFAFRCSKPEKLRQVLNPVGAECDQYIRAALDAPRVIAAWGAIHKAFARREREVLAILAKSGKVIECLEVTSGGHPRHPLYVKGTAQPQPYPMK